MTHDPRETLEPCPFCGDAAELRQGIGGLVIQCQAISCNGTIGPFESADLAAAAWNTRALTASPGVVSVELLNIERATGDRLRSENDKLRATIASPGEQKPCGWQFCCPDGKWIGCDEPPANELRDEPEKFRRVYTSPTPAAGWDDNQLQLIIERALLDDEYFGNRAADEDQLEAQAHGSAALIVESLRREAPAPERVSTPSATAESSASVDARLREALKLLISDIEDYESVNNLAPSPGKNDCWQSVTRAKEALSAVGDEEKKSEGAPAREPGMGWELSDETKARLAEIDDNLRNAAINASNIVAGSPPSPTAERREIVARALRRFHRNSCYPDALDSDVAIGVNAILAALGGR